MNQWLYPHRIVVDILLSIPSRDRSSPSNWMTAAANQSSSSVVFYKYINSNDFYGGWKDGKLYGRGTFKYSDGTVYIGQWIGNNTMHGKGTCKYNYGTVYTGGYSNNKFHGVGHLKLTNGQEHFGIWDNHNLVQRFDHRSRLSTPSPPPTPEKHYPGSRVTL